MNLILDRLLALRPTPTIAFIPASIGEGKNKVSGGVHNARKWVERLEDPPLNELFRAVIDRDTANLGSSRIRVIGRYSFENYLVDPLNLYALLLGEGRAPKIAGIEITRGDEHLIRAMDEHKLQAIASEVVTLVQNVEPGLMGGETSSVSYTVSKSVQVPSWVIEFKGRDLLQIVQRAFGGPKAITQPKLLASLQRARLIPIELATLMAALQLHEV